MNAISRKSRNHHRLASEGRTDAWTELARHHLDLRIHALIMLATAALVGYCGFRVLNIGGSTISGATANPAIAADSTSIIALAVFATVAAVCIFEAHRGWKKATIAGAKHVCGDQETEPSSLSSLTNV